MSPVRKVKIVKKRTTSFPRFQADKFKRMNVGSFVVFVVPCLLAYSNTGESPRVLMVAADAASVVPL